MAEHASGSPEGKTPVPPSALSSDSQEARDLRQRVVAAIGDRYELHEEIGRGGMAVVYAAQDLRLRRRVALKVLPPDMAFRGDVRVRFIREAQTAARLNHPHIVPIYEVDERDGIVYFAMALVEGESLADVLRRTPHPPIGLVGQILEQVADALAYAHACGVVHRDIKPDNILLDRESGRAAVTDFGIARAAESGVRLTQTGIAVGTPAFMSPEQATGEKEIDGRSDLYGLGVVGYLMLAGRLPFEASSTPAMLIKHVTELPVPIRQVRPDAPRALVRVLERCLQKKPADRFEDARAMRDAVHRAMIEIEGGSLSSVSRASERHAPLPAPPKPAPVAVPLPGNLPPIDPNATSGEFRDWRRAVRAERRKARELSRAPQPAHIQLPPPPEQLDEAALERRISAFQGRVMRNGVLILGLGALNAVTTPFPWVIFPAFGISMGLVNEYVKLREYGVRWGDIFRGRRPEAVQKPHASRERIALEVKRIRQRVKWVAGSVATAIGSFIIGSSSGAEIMLIPFGAGVLSMLVSMQLSTVSAVRLHGMGVSIRRALGRSWKELLAAPDERPRNVRLAEELARVVSQAVVDGPYGSVVRDAADDRLTIRDAQERLSPADRQLIPDVGPTADALYERIGAAATALQRLDVDLPGSVLRDLDDRIRKVEREPEDAPDRERRLSLLTRQRASLDELEQRKVTLKRQLDHATMALRTLRLDMVKLRTLGVGAAIDDVGNATQEARALSAEIGRALEIADEVRKI